MTLTSLHGAKVKLGTGRKAKKATVVVLQFSGALNSDGGSEPRGLFAPGRNDQEAGLTFSKPVPLSSAMYSSSAMTVTLVPQGSRKLPKYEQLTIAPGQLTDSLGRPIGGGHTVVATLSKSGTGDLGVCSPGRGSSEAGGRRCPARGRHRLLRPRRRQKGSEHSHRDASERVGQATARPREPFPRRLFWRENPKKRPSSSGRIREDPDLCAA